MRFLALCLVCCLVACNDDKGPETKKDPVKNAPGPGTKKDPVSPPTGVSNIQRMHDDLAEVLAKEEKAETPDPKAVKQVVDGCKKLVKALEMSISTDALQSTRLQHGRMRQTLKDFQVKEDELVREIEEVRAILADADKGTAEIPAGFTRDELNDRMNDRKKQLGTLRKERDKHLEEMRKIEALLTKNEAAPQEASKATRELEAVKALMKRAEALLR